MPLRLSSFRIPTLPARLPQPWHWLLLIALSVLIGGALEAMRLPAALLLGPLLAAIVAQNVGARVALPAHGTKVAQAVIGCLIARAITPQILHGFAAQWPLFVGITLATLALSGGIGWIVTRMGVVPGTTAIWGLLPGGANTMVLMAEEFGADARLVAFMQYLRVLFVTVIASLLAKALSHGHASPATAPSWFPPIPLQPFIETLALIALGVIAGRASRLPNGVMFLPMLVGSALHAAGLVAIELPPWLLAGTYLFLGWNIGLRFTRPVIASAGRALLPTVLSILAMIGFSGLLAVLLVVGLGTEPLAAYLATSPGGADSVAVIAASSHVDSGFVMAFQTARLLAVMLLGPLMSRFIASRVAPRGAAIPPQVAAKAAVARDEAQRLGNVD